MASKFEPPFLALTLRGYGIRGKQLKRFTMGLKTVGTVAVSLGIVLVNLTLTVTAMMMFIQQSILQLLTIRSHSQLFSSLLLILLYLFVINRPHPQFNNLLPILYFSLESTTDHC